MLVLHHVLDTDCCGINHLAPNRKRNAWKQMLPGPFLWVCGSQRAWGLRPALAGLAGMAQMSKRFFLLLSLSQDCRDVPEKNLCPFKKDFSFYHRIRPGAVLKNLFSKKYFSFKRILFFQLKVSISARLLKHKNTFLN